MLAILVALFLQHAEIARDPSAREVFSEMPSMTRGGFAHSEEAVFVVRKADGHLLFVWWPSSGAVDSARWTGPHPAGAIAIVHTHPNWLPKPSSVDIATARTARLPVYVITRSTIVKTDGGAPEVVVSGEW